MWGSPSPCRFLTISVLCPAVGKSFLMFISCTFGTIMDSHLTDHLADLPSGKDLRLCSEPWPSYWCLEEFCDCTSGEHRFLQILASFFTHVIPARVALNNRLVQPSTSHNISSFGLGRFFSFLMFYRVGRTPWTGDQPVARPLPAHRTVQIQNKRTQTSMHQIGFEPAIPVFERAETVHALDHVATVIGSYYRLQELIGDLSSFAVWKYPIRISAWALSYFSHWVSSFHVEKIRYGTSNVAKPQLFPTSGVIHIVMPNLESRISVVHVEAHHNLLINKGQKSWSHTCGRYCVMLSSVKR
jgi:hypothetical protein